MKKASLIITLMSIVPVVSWTAPLSDLQDQTLKIDELVSTKN